MDESKFHIPSGITDTPEFERLRRKWLTMKRCYLARTRHRARYYASGQWVRFVLSHLYYERLAAFVSIAEHLSLMEYWSLLRRVERGTWMWYQRPTLAALLKLRVGAELFMTADEREFYAKLPDSLVVFRAHGPMNHEGKGCTYHTLYIEVASGYLAKRGVEGANHIKVSTLPKRDCLVKQSGLEVLHVPGLGDAQRERVLDQYEAQMRELTYADFKAK